MIMEEDINPGILEMFSSFGFPQFSTIFSIADIVTFVVIGLLLLISFLGYTQVVARKNIHAQKKIDTMYALVFLCVPMSLFVSSLSVQYLMVIMIPFSLFMAILLRLIKHPAIAESIHFILFVAALLTQVLFLV
jgi:hypothetical protein